MTDKAIRARKRTEKEHRSLERRGRLIFFGGLAIVLVIAAVIGVLVYFAVDRSPGLTIEDLEVGTGAEAHAGDAVSVDCTVWSDNGTQITSTGLGVPLVFTLGEKEVIEGLDRGIVGMKVGGKRRLTVPPNLGYGEQAFKDLPANSTITCEVTLLAVR
jgi:FKBP-type peptidyl-prolyl cis-trans isomerase